MNDKMKLALLYDFYNEHVLRGQNDDIGYYVDQITNYDAKNVLVVGAGTGRVAIPISKYAKVSALDFDKERLQVLKQKDSSINTILIDFLKYQSEELFDMIIVPYSTIQFDNSDEKLNLFLKSLYNNMGDKTVAILDVSESFNSKPERKNELIFKDYSTGVKDDVEVYYTSTRHDRYIEFLIEYKLCNQNTSVYENEKYYYYDKDLLSGLINNNNLELLQINDGYKKGEFTHKHLYHCRKLK